MRRIIASVLLATAVLLGASACSTTNNEVTITVTDKELTGRCECTETVYYTNSDGTDGGLLYANSRVYAQLKEGHTYVVVRSHYTGDGWDSISKVVREVEG